MNKSKIKIYLRIEDGGWGRIDKKRPEAWIIDDIIKTHLIMKNIEIIYKQLKNNLKMNKLNIRILVIKRRKRHRKPYCSSDIYMYCYLDLMVYY